MSELTWQALRDTDFRCIDDVVEAWSAYKSRAQEVEAQVIDDHEILKRDGAEDFGGAVADETRAYFKRVVDRFDSELGYVASIQGILLVAADTFAEHQRALEDLFAQAPSELKATGGIGEERFQLQFSGSDNASEYDVPRMEELGAALSEEFRTLMATVRDYDDELAARLRAVDDNASAQVPLISDPNYESRTADWLLAQNQGLLDRIESGHATPEEIADWWGGMSESEQDLIVAEYPELVGPLDGIDTDDRDTANRTLLDSEITDLDAQIAALQEELANTPMRNGVFPNPEFWELTDELEALHGQRDSLENLQEQISEPYSENGHEADYFLLGYSSEADGQAIVSVGNPDTADNVNVYVPGTGANLADVDGILGRTETMFKDASLASHDSTASILWLGYDAPDNVANATSGDYAEDAAKSLDSFVDGIRASDQNHDTNLTLTGHSYGSTTIGIAARDERLDVDNMIFVGSPGVGVDNAGDLGIGSENVWSSTNPEDVIQYATVHGTDPTSADFGGNTFTSDATREGSAPWNSGDNVGLKMAGAVVSSVDGSIDNHKAYWDEGNAARENMAFIITGQTEEVK